MNTPMPQNGNKTVLITGANAGIGKEIARQFAAGGSVASREHHRQRHALINANPALVERDLMKYRSLAVDFAEALCQRGVDVSVARLTAEVGIDVFVAAYQQWLAVDNEADLPTINKIILSLLAKITPSRRDASTDS